MTATPRPRPLPLLLAALAVAAAGCVPTFDPASKVESFRLLAVQAEPPQIADPAPDPAAAPARPPGATLLTSLVADERHLTEPGRRSTVLHFACTPEPADPSQALCTAFANLRDPMALVAGSLSSQACTGGVPQIPLGQGIVGGISLSGLEACDGSGCGAATIAYDPADPTRTLALPPPVYILPAELDLDSMAADAPERMLGMNVVVVSLAVDATPEELFSGSDLCQAFANLSTRLEDLRAERASVTAVKRIVIRGPDETDEPNRNPVLAGITLPSDVFAGQVVDLTPLLPADPAFQPYTRREENGAAIEAASEAWAYSWYATSGKYEDEHSWSDKEPQVSWTAPGAEGSGDVPEAGKVRFWVVVRDFRGGIAWASQEAVIQ
ncbi:MAG: hypothetical protein HY901_13825 [Deltaproteobacteria bacterium]|nr:hypothetical protein [Deltaproteobacteria bacterium]